MPMRSAPETPAETAAGTVAPANTFPVPQSPLSSGSDEARAGTQLVPSGSAGDAKQLERALAQYGLDDPAVLTAALAHARGARPDLHRDRASTAAARRQEDDEAGDIVGSITAGLRDQIARGVALVLRQSTGRQAERNLGSARWQEDQINFLRPFGATVDNVTLFDARGESGREGANKPVFSELLRRVEQGEFGVVVCAFADRLSRFEDDSRRLYRAVLQCGGRIVIGGQILNPADPGHWLILQIYAILAEFENAQRTLRMVSSRDALVATFAHQVPLPTGLVWASKDDPAYLALAREARLLHWVDALDETHAKCVVDGQVRYILPEPDAEIFTSVQLRFEWMLETGDIDAVIDRIHTDPRWPRPGEIPARTTFVFDADPKRRPEWVPLKSVTTHDRRVTARRMASNKAAADAAFVRASPSLNAQRTRLRTFFLSPAYYTYYTFRSPFLADRADLAAVLPGTVDVPYKTPEYFCAPERRAEIRRLLSRDTPYFRRRGDRTSPSRGERPHALPLVLCAHPHEDGRPCGRTVRSVVSPPLPRYGTTACPRDFGHSAAMPQPLLDRAVLEIMAASLKAEVVGASLDRVRHRTATSDHIVADLQRQERLLSDRIGYYGRKAYEANCLVRDAKAQLDLLTAIGSLPAESAPAPPSCAAAERGEGDQDKAPARDASVSVTAALTDQAPQEESLEVRRAMAEEAVVTAVEAEAEWERQQAEALQQRRAVQAQRVAAEREAMTGEAVESTELDAMLSLGRRVSELLDRGRAHPTQLRALVAVCVKAVHVWNLGETIYSVEVEFPSGQRVPRLCVTKSVRLSQPERVFAWMALRPWLDPKARLADLPAADAAAAATAGALNEYFEAVRQWAMHPLRARYAPWTADRAWRAALEHEHFESVEGRDTATHPHTDITTLSDRLALPVADVLALVFADRLGPARVIGGELMVAPTETELHEVLPEFARRCVAEANRWPIDDVALIADLVCGLTPDRSRAESQWDRPRWARRPPFRAPDAAGRWYTRRSWFGLQGRDIFEKYYDEAAPPDVRARAREHWMTSAEAAERFPHLPARLIQTVAPRVRPVPDSGTQFPMYYWLGPEVVAELTAVQAARRPRRRSPPRT